jgi:UDP-N-acetylmuramoyl-L-alanyl-D-glutamate--2,6-diaminopimelate ligase
MKVSYLLKDIWYKPVGTAADPEICAIDYDSRHVRPGSLFFALRGEKADGHDFIEQAALQGAAAVVMERDCPLPPGVAGFVTDNGRRGMSLAAAAFYGDPTAAMTVVGVTGTNGKTTTTYLLESILRAAGKRPAVVGTINYRFGDRVLPSLHTTPESVDLLRTLAEFRDAGADALVMEASSHALEQHRVDGVRFDVAVFTNLTPEHLDYHKDMESYFAGKRRLFALTAANGGRAVVNVDDPYGRQLAAGIADVLTCGSGAPAAVRPLRASLTMDGIEAEVLTPAGPLTLRSRLLGDYNLHNLLGAVAAGIALGLPPSLIAAALETAPQVPGRLERVENDLGALLLVDYAHTGDALENVLATLAALQPRRIITVFGCGGDRDRKKRPVMGEVVARYSDLAVITSDNPRTEDPLAIIDEIRGGVQRVHPREWSREEASAVPGKGFVAIADRRLAIAFAVGLLREGDVLLVAGKGHEDYQIIGRERFPFDDREELRRALAGREATT